MAKEKKSGLNEWETLARSLQEIEEKNEIEETKPVKGRGRSAKKTENEAKEASEMKKPVKKARSVKAEAAPEEAEDQKDREETAAKKAAAPKTRVKKENVAKPKKRVKKAVAGKETAKKPVKASTPSLDLLSQIEKLAESKEQAENTDSFVENKIDLENDDFSLDDFFANNDEESLKISWGRPPRSAAVEASNDEEDLLNSSDEEEKNEFTVVDEDRHEDDLPDGEKDLDDDEDELEVPEIVEQVVAVDGDEVEVLVSLTAIDSDDDLVSQTTVANPTHESEYEDYDRGNGSRRDGDFRHGRRNRGRRDRSDRFAEDRRGDAQNAEDRRGGFKKENVSDAEVRKAPQNDFSPNEDLPVTEKVEAPKDFSLNDFFADDEEDALNISWGKPSRFTAVDEKKSADEEIGFSPKKTSEAGLTEGKKDISGNRRDRSRDDRCDRRRNRADRSEKSREENNEARDFRSSRRNDRGGESPEVGEERIEERRDIRRGDSSRCSREDHRRDDRRRNINATASANVNDTVSEDATFRGRDVSSFNDAEESADLREKTAESRESKRPGNRRNADRRVRSGSDDLQGRSSEERLEKSMPSWEEAISLVVKNNMARHGNRHENKKRR